MIPFNHNIKSIEEVKKEFPGWFGDWVYSHNKIKKFIDEEILKFRGAEVTAEMKEIATARGIYHFLWCMDHNLDQMLEYRWKPDKIDLLVRKMQKKGYDPYSLTEDTAALYIESLPGYGFKEKIINGKVCRFFDP